MQDFIFWVAIHEITCSGKLSFYITLIETFGTMEQAWVAQDEKIRQSLKAYPKECETLLAQRIKYCLKTTRNKLERHNINVIVYYNEFYPKALRYIYSPPPILYVYGSLPDGHQLNFALVGSRNASIYGLKMAKKIAMELASLGCVISSGLARGIDTEAHKGCLDVQGKTIAILGSGLDNIYPRENVKLTQDIVANGGGIISEFPMGTLPIARNFPVRNRIISGLSNGVVIIEGSKKSGSLITAELALEQGKDVFAVPGRVTDELSHGPLSLIQQGAKLIVSTNDILEEYGQMSFLNEQHYLDKNCDSDEKKILGILKDQLLTIDEISLLVNIPINRLSYKITLLELNRKIKRSPGNKFYA